MSKKTEPRSNAPSKKGNCPECGGTGKVGMYWDTCNSCGGTGKSQNEVNPQSNLSNTNKSELETYVKDMFFMVWRDATIGLGADKHVVVNSATNMVMKRLEESKAQAVEEALTKAHRANNTHDFDNETDEYIDELLNQLSNKGASNG